MEKNINRKVCVKRVDDVVRIANPISFAQIKRKNNKTLIICSFFLAKLSDRI